VSRARAKNQEYQALQLLNSVVFPEDVVSVQVTDEDLAAPLLKLDATGHEEVAIVFSRSGDGEARTLGDLLPVAVVCRVVQRMRMPGGGVQVVFQGLFRGRILQTIDADGMRVSVDEITVPDDDTPECNQRVLAVLDLLAEYLPRDGTYPEDLESILRMNLRSPGRFADLVAAYLHLPLATKRRIAVAGDVLDRLGLLGSALEGELERFSVETDIHRRVREQIEERQLR
jgi:ATP-dependent Lon protease